MSRIGLSILLLTLLCVATTIKAEETNTTEVVQEVPKANEKSLKLVEDFEVARFGGGGGKGGKRGKQKKDGGIMQKILPFMVMPFMISSAMIPMALMGLKFMLLKSAFIGKIAIILLLINMFTRFNNQGGVYSHNINLSPAQKDVAMGHYGYNGDEEYGAYVNKKRRRRR